MNEHQHIIQRETTTVLNKTCDIIVVQSFFFLSFFLFIFIYVRSHKGSDLGCLKSSILGHGIDWKCEGYQSTNNLFSWFKFNSSKHWNWLLCDFKEITNFISLHRADDDERINEPECELAIIKSIKFYLKFLFIRIRLLYGVG